MKQGKIIISCPYCNRVLFTSIQWKELLVEVKCSKCGSMLNVIVENNTLSVRESIGE